MAFLTTLEALLYTPTAPYREQWMMETLRGLLATIPGAEVRQDRWGNIAARIRRGSVPRPIAFVAHLDHPGFVVTGEPEGGRVPVVFEGGVHSDYFPGTGVRLYRSSDEEGVAAVVEEVSEKLPDGDRNRTGFLRTEGDARGAVLGMWDIEKFRVDGDTVHGRAIDDLGGVATIIEMLARVAAREEPTDTIGLFTRAEESGFRGALALCLDERREELLPSSSDVISIETSSARPTVPVGGGAVLRVGDRTTVFDSEMVRTFGEVTARAAEKAGRRPLVRALMDGGTCEASAFNLFGYRSAGMCLPLGNYHNMDAERRQIAPEYISMADAEDLIATMTEAALADRDGSLGLGKLREEYRALAENAAAKLTAS